MHTQLPQIVQRYTQKQAQLYTDNTTMRYNGDILLVAFTLEDIVKGRLTATRYIMEAFALRRNPFARTRQEIIHLLRPAAADFRIFQALPGTEAYLLQQIQRLVGHIFAHSQRCCRHAGTQHRAAVNFINRQMLHIRSQLLRLLQTFAVQRHVDASLKAVSFVAVRFTVTD